MLWKSNDIFGTNDVKPGLHVAKRRLSDLKSDVVDAAFLVD